MYKVLLVDDESWILKGLKGRIDWEKYGFYICGQARNGVEAYEKILELNPDVVFTDIRMPRMNGLELIQKVKEISLNTRFVILSGYAEFSYAQKAMNQGAIGYCVKPFEEDEIAGLLKRISQSIRKSKYNLEAELFELLEEDNINNKTRIVDIIREIGLEWSSGGMLLLVSIGNGMMKFPPDHKYITINLGVSKKAYMMHYDKITPVREYLKNEIPDNIKGIGISKKIDDASGMQNAMEETEIAAYQCFLAGAKSVYPVENLQNEDHGRILMKLDEAISARDTVTIDKIFSDLYRLFQDGRYTIKHAYIIYNALIYFIYKSSDRFQEQYLVSHEQPAVLFSNVYEMLEYLKNQVLVSLKQPDIPEETSNEVFDEILQYINTNYEKEISLQSLSKDFFVSPCYIARLFRKELGDTFVKYLSKIRINHACDLLRTTNLLVCEISEKVGYNDYFYFCRIFKRITEKTPSQYRE